MTADFSPELQRELLDDFYTECAELFTVVHAQLAALASPTARLASRRPALEQLQRAVHTLKGNCSIVGLRRGEELAHAVETVLKRIPVEGDRDYTPALAEVLEGVRQLESAVSAERQPSTTTPAPVPNPAALVGSEPTPGSVWRATFAPSAELNARGVNLNAIRARLAHLGTITHAAPIIRADGSMIFEFDLQRPAAAGTVEDAAGWARDGVQFQPPPSSVRPRPPATSHRRPRTPEGRSHPLISCASI